jgi:hypothetical protein
LRAIYRLPRACESNSAVLFRLRDMLTFFFVAWRD